MAEIFQLVGVLVTIYFLAVKIVMLWKQCPEEGAKEIIASGCKKAAPKIASWWQENASGLPPKAKESDSILDTGLIDAIWVAIQLVDEVLYKQLRDLAALGTTLFSADYHSGLPCIYISLLDTNDSEKQRLGTILAAVIQQRLTSPEYDTRVLVDWTRRSDLDMPVLEIRYAKSEEQRKIMNNVFARSRANIIAKNAPVVDDTEEIDLF